uniref:C-type lectin domain-containing protein n=1 Tax=Knipowitschia caucasica TaxID=637954 RepID=A0AAV2LMP4_KNICA
MKGVQRMWTNQRFLGDSWVSVGTEVWSNGGSLDKCPVNHRCAAVKEDGVLEAWNCQDQLYFRGNGGV